ncbi:MAG: trehalose-6-phosphate synthase [Chloroflexota bacterium]|nr:MAG: trehalose-6-phosphate synthase [Chloroflexota bacterium]
MDAVSFLSRPAADLEAIDLCETILKGSRLILASNRGPMEFACDEEGQLKARRGAGGVITALGNVARYCKATWVANAVTDGDREAVRTMGASFASLDPTQDLRVRFLSLDPRCHHRYYNIFCNSVLWFLQHEMSNTAPLPVSVLRDAWKNGYVPANRDFATAIAKEVKKQKGPAVVMLNDYHLYLTASYLRGKVPEALLQQFVHIPWPAPERWNVLRRPMVKSICKGLVANDIVGFQTERDVENFLRTADTFLERARVNHRRRSVSVDGHTMYARHYPISVDVGHLRRLAESPELIAHTRRLRLLCAEQTIVRVDRMDPSKNIARGFRAYELVLQKHPELLGKVKFLSLLVPSRSEIREYRDYASEVFQTVEEINRKYGRQDWRPIEVIYEHNYVQALAALSLYDVLLVNPVADGMNLVSKEGPTLNESNGVLVLSRQAGSAAQLKGGALMVDAFDVNGTAEALYRALTMKKEGRRMRLRQLRRAIEQEDLERWFYRQMKDLWLLQSMHGEVSEPIRWPEEELTAVGWA